MHTSCLVAKLYRSTNFSLLVMKQKLFLLLTVVAVVFSACRKEKTSETKPVEIDSIEIIEVPDTIQHIAQGIIDLEGEYKGIMPCEDCDGVETALYLSFDNTFTQSLYYIGKGGPYESKGTFKWDETGNIIELYFEDGSTAKYQVEEGKLTLLDELDYPIEGYELTK